MMVHRILVALLCQMVHAYSNKVAAVTHVDAVRGSTDPSCGSTSSPCKYLYQGVAKTPNHGKVLLTGKQIIDGVEQKQIKISDKSVTIVGETSALVTGVFVRGRFRVSGTGSIHMTNITFKDIVVVNMMEKAKVVFQKCTFEKGKLDETTRKALIQLNEGSESSLNVNGCVFKYPGPIFTIKPAVSRTSPDMSPTLIFQNSRFIKTKGIRVETSDNVNMTISKCTFIKSVGIWIQNTPRLNLSVSSCIFRNFQFPPIVIIRFTHLRARSSGIIIIRGNVFRGTNGIALNKPAVEISRMQNIAMDSNLFIGIAVSKENGAVRIRYSFQVSIKSSKFIRCQAIGDFGGAIFIKYGTVVEIRNCSFSHCTATRGGSMAILSVRYSSIRHTQFASSSAIVSGGALYLVSVERSVFKGCMFSNSSAGVGTDKKMEERTGREGGALKIIGMAELEVVNCKFIDNSAADSGGAICNNYLKFGPKGETFISNCLFERNKATVNGGALTIMRIGRSEIRLSDFNENKADVGGAVCIIDTHENKTMSLISQNSFKSNSAVVGGALYLVCRRTYQRSVGYLIEESHFSNNSADLKGQSIYANENITIKSIRVDGSDKHNVYHIHAEFGEIVFSNSSFQLHRQYGSTAHRKTNAIFLSSSRVRMLNNSLNFTCPSGYNVDLKNSSYVRNVAKNAKTVFTFFKADCKSCPYGSYSLFKGKLYLKNISSAPQLKTYTCHQCPTGAVCDIEVKAVDNYWGYRQTESTLGFILCPSGYCCSVKTTQCRDYQTCVGGRNGRLCGTCAEGYKQAFFNQKCILRGGSCDLNTFILYVCAYCIAYTILIIVVTNAKDIISGITSCVRSHSSKEEGNEVALEQTNNTSIDGALLIKETSQQENKDEAEDVATSSRNIASSDSSSFSMGAYVQIVILYFQVASLLSVKYQDQSQVTKSKGSNNQEAVKDIIGDIANFQVMFYQSVCPSNELTLPQKEMILFSMKIGTFLILIFIFLITEFIRLLFSCAKKGKNSKTKILEEAYYDEMDATSGKIKRNIPVPTHLSFGNRLKYTFLKLMKMYYTPITKACLTMIHCVSINGVRYLYVYADHACYSTWQIAIIVVILPGILLFPICFELALRQLKNKQITTSGFVVGIGFPYYMIFLHIRSILRGLKKPVEPSDDERTFVKMILEAEEELFTEDKNSLGWNIIQLYRTFALTLVSICIINPLYRQVCLLPLLLLFAVYDARREPYKSWFLSKFNTFASRCLVLVLGCNVIPSVSYIVDVSITPYIVVALRILSVVEMLLYAAVPLTLPVWKVWLVAKYRRNELK